MDFKFNLTIDDWLDFNNFHLSKSKQFKRTLNISKYSLPIIFCFLIYQEFLKGDDFFYVAAVFYSAVSLLWIIFYPKFLKKRTLSNIKKSLLSNDNSGILGEHLISISESHLFQKIPGGESKYDWKSLRLEETKDYYFLYNTAVSAILIPKNKIDIDLTELDSLLKSKIK